MGVWMKTTLRYTFRQMVYLTDEMSERMHKAADDMGLSFGAWCRLVLWKEVCGKNEAQPSDWVAEAVADARAKRRPRTRISVPQIEA